jgi:Right handed beta helix region
LFFRIPVDEPLDLTLRSPLPAITNPSLIVDGANQPTTVTDTLRGVPVTLQIPHPGNVALHGSSTAPTGLSISGGVNLSNLELTGFGGAAITLSGGSAKALQSLNVHDNGTGVAIGGSNATLASSALSGNGVGLVLGGSGNFVQGSTITNSSAQGVSITGTNNTLGGQARNLISGNAGDGVVVRASSGGGHRIIGNFIGVDVTGTVAQPNGGNGINLNVNTEPMTIGGTSAGERNVISGNTGAGVVVNLARSLSRRLGTLFVRTASSTTERSASTWRPWTRSAMARSPRTTRVIRTRARIDVRISRCS